MSILRGNPEWQAALYETAGSPGPGVRYAKQVAQPKPATKFASAGLSR